MDHARRLFAEFIGTLLLVCTVVGSGIMADALSSDDAVALLGNTIPTGAMLFVLITLLGPLSGAHFNPAVSLVMAIRGALPWRDLAPYAAVQVAGAIAGTLVAHAMFGLDIVQLSEKSRTGGPQWLAEAIATFGLLFTILGGLRARADALPMLVALYITAAYWFTASTSFANPAVTIGRALTNTFAGIDPAHVAAFILAQLIGALAAMALSGWLFGKD